MDMTTFMNRLGETSEQFDARAAQADPQWHAEMKAYGAQRDAAMREFAQRVMSLIGIEGFMRMLGGQQQPMTQPRPEMLKGEMPRRRLAQGIGMVE